MIKKLFVKSLNSLNQLEVSFRLLLFYIIIMPVMRMPSSPFLAERIQFTEFLFLVLFFVWAKALIKNKKFLYDPGLNKPFLFFIFFCLLSFLHSVDLFRSTLEIIGLIYLYILVILIVDIVDTKEKLDIAIKVWIGTLTAILMLAFVGFFISYITGKTNIFCLVYSGCFPYLKTVYRINSFFRHPLGLASYLVSSFCFVVSDLLLTQNEKYKVFLKILIVLICLAMIAIISRDIVAFMVASLLIYNYFNKKRNLIFKINCLFLIFLIVVISMWFVIFDSLFHVDAFKIQNISKEDRKELVVNIEYAHGARMAQKKAALEMIKRHPFLGVGLAMYPLYIDKLNSEDYFKNLAPIYFYTHAYKYGTQYLNFLPPVDPHNDTLQYFAETGVFGGLAFIFFIATFLYLILINLNNTDNRYFKVRLYCFFASFIGVLVETLGLDLFKTRYLWFLIALTLATIKIIKNKKVVDTA